MEGSAPLVHIVFPRLERRVGDGGGQVRRDESSFPLRPLPIFILGALARRHGWRVRLIDENREPLPTDRPDLAFITVWTCLAPSAYELSERYRRDGVPVVLGGVHASVLPSEALRHADSVVVGEAESVIGSLLEDAAGGRLQQVYRGHWIGMDAVPSVSEYADLYTSGPFRRFPLHGIQTSRGCRFNCSYCSVIRMNGRGMRHMEPERVVEEFRALSRLKPRIPGGTPVYIHDDDLMSDRDYTAEMFEALVRAGIRAPLIVQASSGIGRDDEVLELAARAGLVSIFIGLESVSRASLVQANKKNRPKEYADLVARIHRHGIGVAAGIIFGFDTDEPDVFGQTVDFLDDAGIDMASFRALTPLPGTAVFADLHEQNRIRTYDWSMFDVMHTVIEPERMTAEQLEAGVLHANRAWYSSSARARRFARQLRGVSPRVAAAFAFAGRRFANNLEEMTSREKAGFEPHPDDLALVLEASKAPAQEAIWSAADRVTGPGPGATVTVQPPGTRPRPATV